MCEVLLLFDGYSKIISKGKMIANCSCTLIKGEHNIIVDTMTAWDGDKITNALRKQNVNLEDIHYVISTHGHSDHIGNNNLFLKAKHIVGFSISFRDQYQIHDFDSGEEFIINSDVRVVPTPGHTLSDVTVLVTTKENETVAIAGDLFEKFEDIENSLIWEEAGSENSKLQRENRAKISSIAHWIVPGHGPKFKVTDKIRKVLKDQAP